MGIMGEEIASNHKPDTYYEHYNTRRSLQGSDPQSNLRDLLLPCIAL